MKILVVIASNLIYIYRKDTKLMKTQNLSQLVSAVGCPQEK